MKQVRVGDNRAQSGLSHAQVVALENLCWKYKDTFDATNYTHPFELPEGWVAGWVGPIYVGCSPDGEIHT